MAKWLLDDTVDGAIYTIAKDREVKWSWQIGDKPVGYRHSRISWHGDVRSWLRMLGDGRRHVDMYVSTNILDWNELPELPPQYRIHGKGHNADGIKRYSEMWNTWLTPADCRSQGLDWKKIWIGKNMIWDFDHPDIGIAFEWANAVFELLQNELGLSPQLVFSGGKGFHVWLNHRQSAALAGTSLHKLADAGDADPLRTLGKIYAKKVKEITFEATGESHRSLDLSPNYRQGVIRIPYSLNKAIVWPLSERERNELSSRSFRTLREVEKVLQPDQWRERFGGRSYVRGRANRAFKRLLDVFIR